LKIEFTNKKFITIKKHKIMKKLSLIIAAVFIFGVGNVVKADNGNDRHQVSIGISTHAFVDIESTTGSSAIILSPSAPTEAGLGLSFTNISNSDLWLNYSSIVSSNGSKNSISAKIEGNLPTGVSIELFVGDCVENGDGNVGQRKGGGNPVELTDSEQEIIHNIESGYTGNGSGSGHNLTYTLKADNNVDYEDIVADSEDIEIVYTITEN
jgi:hypothetical protein